MCTLVLCIDVDCLLDDEKLATRAAARYLISKALRQKFFELRQTFLERMQDVNVLEVSTGAMV